MDIDNKIQVIAMIIIGIMVLWLPIALISVTEVDPVMVCIREYTTWIDEKYNNPDTVSNLSEDNYSQVVKTCKEVFGNK